MTGILGELCCQGIWKHGFSVVSIRFKLIL
jgi:hypothetical protein